MTKKLPDNPLGLPTEFYATIEPYVDLNIPAEKRQVADTPNKLLRIWKSALSAREAHPESQELIAEWAMSAGASSPLVNDSDYFEDIHARFGRLEVSGHDNNSTAWEELKSIVDSLDV